MQVFDRGRGFADGGEGRWPRSERQAQVVSGDRATRRVVVDDRTGAHWMVDERDARREPGARGEHYLCFDSADTRRRVWRYPEGWQQMDDADLLALSELRPGG
jgi:hypothetical protein